MAARDDDLMRVSVQVLYPAWLEELSADEFESVISSCKKRAIEAFHAELDKAGRYWRMRRDAKAEGQMDIYDYA